MSQKRTWRNTQENPPEQLPPLHALELENPTLSNKLLASSLHDQNEAAASKFGKKCPADDIKDPQITTAVSLVNTGFGEIRVPQLFFHMFFHMFTKAKKPVILVLNPLDSLVDNQVNFLPGSHQYCELTTL